MRLSRIDKKYRYQIDNFIRYYSSKEREELEGRGLEGVKAYAWRYAIRKMEQETPKELTETVTTVYIARNKSMTKALKEHLGTTYQKGLPSVCQWFVNLEGYFFEGVKKHLNNVIF